jgi:hypothetical protein
VTRKRNAFPTTLTDDKAIAAAAMMGNSKMAHAIRLRSLAQDRRRALLLLFSEELPAQLRKF